MYYGSVLSYFIITENTLCQLVSCFACIYVAILIPHFNLNCTHMHFQVHNYFVWVFIMLLTQAPSYQVPMSLNNLTPCLYLCIHFIPTLQVKWQICIFSSVFITVCGCLCSTNLSVEYNMLYHSAI